MKVSDYIWNRLADLGVEQAFLVTGGGAMHLNDSLSRNGRIRFVCNHHEQACAVAGEGYARTAGKPAAINVTSGPGGTNTLTGVLGQWLDSIPVIYISGQVRFNMTVASTGLPLRQLGDQEADIVPIVKTITKYAVMVTDPKTIRYHVEKAMHLARTGRPGPVWLDVPLDVQAAVVNPDELKPYDPAEEGGGTDSLEIDRLAGQVLMRMTESKRPVLLAGAGIRLSGASGLLLKVADKLCVPLQTAWDAIDLVPFDHPYYFGRPSTLGQRAANFVFQNADLLLSIGCRLNVRQIGYAFESVAREAYRIVVDIDPVELRKPTIIPHLPICCDAKAFLQAMIVRLESQPMSPKTEWLEWCRQRREKYPPVLPEHRAQGEGVNPYYFCEILSRQMAEGEVIVSSNGASCVMPIQAMSIKKGQRHLVNSGCAAMGYGLPAAIGACLGNGRRRVICLEGDGSIQMNIQELQTVVHHSLPLKIFIFNNGGYLSIRSTQQSFFDGHFVGESPSSGVSFPDMVKISKAYGIEAIRISSHQELVDGIRHALNTPGPILCDVMMDRWQGIEPRIASRRLPDGRMVSSPLEDMFPLLDREEFHSNMIIGEWVEKKC